jgi:hypothetical protein
MGKQIEFFMTKLDETNFLIEVLNNGGLILDDKVNTLSLDDVKECEAISLFITLPGLKIEKNKSGFVDAITSEVIQFSRCMIFAEEVRTGRLWAEFKYYNAGQLVNKSKEFSDIFKKYEKWIKGNYRLSKCKFYYIGNDAFKLHKTEGFKMVAGPKHIVEFELD